MPFVAMNESDQFSIGHMSSPWPVVLQRHFFAFCKDLVAATASMPFRQGCGPVHAFNDLSPTDAGVVRAKGDFAFLRPVGNHAHFGAAEIVGPEILKPHAFDAENPPVIGAASCLHPIVAIAVGTLRCGAEQIHDL